MHSFIRKKYENNITTVGSIVKFSFPSVHTDNHMRSNQGPDWYHVMHYTMKHLYMKLGIKRFGTRGVDSVSKELKQMHLCNTFKPLDPHTLSKEEYYEVLESDLFLKENRDKPIKLSMVADGSKKRDTINNQDTPYPTAALESVLIIPIIDAEEVRYI